MVILLYMMQNWLFNGFDGIFVILVVTLIELQLEALLLALDWPVL